MRGDDTGSKCHYVTYHMHTSFSRRLSPMLLTTDMMSSTEGEAESHISPRQKTSGELRRILLVTTFCLHLAYDRNTVAKGLQEKLNPNSLHNNHDWGEHERAPHRRAKHVKICMHVCLSLSLTQISLTPIATLFNNGFSGGVQNSSRAFNYPCSGCALARDRRN